MIRYLWLRVAIVVVVAVVSAGLQPRTLVVGSNEVYDKRAARSGAVDESWPLGPSTPYGISKAAQDFLAQYYFEWHGVPVVHVRPFNHIGPRQSTRFVAAAFAAQVARIAAGQSPPIVRVGNLAARRDFTDVRDIVRAYALLMEMGKPGELYNLGSGKSWSIGQLLNEMLSVARVEAELEVSPDLYRSDFERDLVCDFSRVQAACGWRPEIPMGTTITDLLGYERERIWDSADGRRAAGSRDAEPASQAVLSASILPEAEE